MASRKVANAAKAKFLWVIAFSLIFNRSLLKRIKNARTKRTMTIRLRVFSFIFRRMLTPIA